MYAELISITDCGIPQSITAIYNWFSQLIIS